MRSLRRISPTGRTKLFTNILLQKILESLSIPELKVMLKHYNQRIVARLFVDAHEMALFN